MGSYLNSNLIKDEKVIYEGDLSIWSQLPLLILGVLGLPFIGLGLLAFVGVYINIKSTELAFTNKRVIAKHGFINRRTVELNLNKIESIQVDQDILGRMFNYGTLIISGAGNPQAPIKGISDPLVFRKALMEYQDQNPIPR